MRVWEMQKEMWTCWQSDVGVADFIHAQLISVPRRSVPAVSPARDCRGWKPDSAHALEPTTLMWNL